MRVGEGQTVIPVSLIKPTKTIEVKEPPNEDSKDIFEDFAPNPLAHLYAPRKSVFVSKLIDWKSAIPTWRCHWWPKRATVPGGDPINNIFGLEGALAKLDQAFLKDSRRFELRHNQVSDSLFIGHSREAARVSGVLHEPKRSVVCNGVRFSPHEISGLLCKVVTNLVEEDMGAFGPRTSHAPVAFLDDLLWATSSGSARSFTLVIDDGEFEKEIPYDQVTIFKSSQKTGKPGTTRSDYDAVLKSTGFPLEERRYRFSIDYDNDGVPQGSAWLDSSKLPELILRVTTKGDLRDKGNWSELKASANPEISLEDVFEIYKLST